MLNLDTHILIRSLEESLTSRERTILKRDPHWSISAIVLWELTKLHILRRINYGLDHPAMSAALETVHIWPIDSAVCLSLRALDFHSDPADEMIAATSLAHQLPLVTRDERIRASRVIRCL